MKILKTAALALIGALPFLPAMAEDVTTVKFAQFSRSAGIFDNDIEFTVIKSGPAEVEVLWATGPANIAAGSDGTSATPNADFTMTRGSLFFGATETSKSFSVPILKPGVARNKTKLFQVGLAFPPFDNHGGHTVELKDNGKQAVGVILPCSPSDAIIFNIACQ